MQGVSLRDPIKGSRGSLARDMGLQESPYDRGFLSQGAEYATSLDTGRPNVQVGLVPLEARAPEALKLQRPLCKVLIWKPKPPALMHCPLPMELLNLPLAEMGTIDESQPHGNANVVMNMHADNPKSKLMQTLQTWKNHAHP